MGQTVAQYVLALVWVFREVRRVLRSTGTLWLNLGDTWQTVEPTNASTAFGKWMGSGNWNPVARGLCPARRRLAASRTSSSQNGGRQCATAALNPTSISFSWQNNGTIIFTPQKNEPAARHPSTPLLNRCAGDAATERSRMESETDATSGTSSAAHFAAYPEERTPSAYAQAVRGSVVLDPFMGTGTRWPRCG